jgi:hypothetical protein
VKLTKKISHNDMLLSWGIAEAPRLALPEATLQRILSRQELTSDEKHLVIARIQQLRPHMTDGLRRLPIDWWEGEVLVADLPTVRVIDGWDCSDVMNLADLLVRKPELAYASFIEEKCYGVPIFVSPASNGPICQAEGTHRCLTLLRDFHGSSKTIDVIVGVAGDIRKWFWWNSNRNGTPRSA